MSARPARGTVTRSYAAFIHRFRWMVLAFWAITVPLLTIAAPSLGAGGDQLANVIPLDSPAIQAEIRSVEEFGFPLSSRTAVLQHNPDGLSVYTRAQSVLDAVSVDQGPQPYPLLGAIPVPNNPPLFRNSGERGTAVLTYLFMKPSSGFARQQDAAQDYIDTYLSGPKDSVTGVVGSIPARAEQANLVEHWLPVLEVLTVIAIALLVAINFRSAVAPIVALAGSALAFVVMVRVAGLVGLLLGIAVPAELEPLLVALLLGIVTDYTIFYLSALAARKRAGDTWNDGFVEAVGSFTPIIIAAGVTVAAGTAALLAATSDFFRSFGPPMALAVLVGVLVSITFVPALLAIIGPRVFWPSPLGRSSVLVESVPIPWSDRVKPKTGSWLVDRLTRKPQAAAVLALCTIVLLLMSFPLTQARLGIGFTQSLPEDNPVKMTSAVAGEAYAPGITSPTTVLLEGKGVASQFDALVELQRRVEAQPGIAAVVGPSLNLTERQLGVFLSDSDDAARMLIVMSQDPLEAVAIQDLGLLEKNFDALLQGTALEGASYSFAGDTALANGLISTTSSDLRRIALAALIVNLLLLMGFLRAVVAPLYLLACSALALTASLGMTTLFFQGLLGYDGLTFYVPFATAVLLVSLGSDYNIFGVGHVWEMAHRRPLLEAVRVAVPQSTRAITAAGITLAVSFGLLAVIPLRSFRELAFTMALGIMIDVLIVRSLMVPSLLTLVGYASGWPGGHLKYAKHVEKTESVGREAASVAIGST
ncbi:MAG: MMPL family transporter [Actinomycetes bacterium]